MKKSKKDDEEDIVMFGALTVKKFPNGMVTCEYTPFPKQWQTPTLVVIFNDKGTTTIFESYIGSNKKNVIRYI